MVGGRLPEEGLEVDEPRIERLGDLAVAVLQPALCPGSGLLVVERRVEPEQQAAVRAAEDGRPVLLAGQLERQPVGDLACQRDRDLGPVDA